MVRKTSKREKKIWKDNTPDMMTEEETAGEEGYIRHQPDWRSTHFNSFTRKLDSRLSKTVKCITTNCVLTVCCLYVWFNFDISFDGINLMLN